MINLNKPDTLIFDQCFHSTPVSSGFDPFSYGSPYFISWADDPEWTPPANGANVTSWRNDAGDPFTSSGSPPSFALDYYSEGKSGIQFNPVDTEFLSLAASPAQGTPFTLVVVATPLIINDVELLLAGLNQGDSSGLAIQRNTYQAQGLAGAGFSEAVIDADAESWPVNTTHVVEFRAVVGSGASSLYDNNVLIDTGTTTAVSGVDIFYVGSFAGLLASFNGVIPFVAGYPSASAPEELISGLQTYYDAFSG